VGGSPAIIYRVGGGGYIPPFSHVLQNRYVKNTNLKAENHNSILKGTWAYISFKSRETAFTNINI
jgi:hypothetical protein